MIIKFGSSNLSAVATLDKECQSVWRTLDRDLLQSLYKYAPPTGVIEYLQPARIGCSVSGIPRTHAHRLATSGRGCKIGYEEVTELFVVEFDVGYFDAEVNSRRLKLAEETKKHARSHPRRSHGIA